MTRRGPKLIPYYEEARDQAEEYRNAQSEELDKRSTVDGGEKRIRELGEMRGVWQEQADAYRRNREAIQKEQLSRAPYFSLPAWMALSANRRDSDVCKSSQMLCGDCLVSSYGGYTMNLTYFLEKVDQACDERNKAQLAAFIRQRARMLPEDQRTAFLNQLTGKEDQAVRCFSGSDISRETIADALAELAQIAEGNVRLTGRLNEEYDDWYGEGNEFLFEDPCGIGKFIEAATDLAHRCVDAGEYEGAFSIGSALMNLQIKVGGEYADYSDEAMTVSSMKENELTGCNLRRLVTETLYAAFNDAPPEERPDVLYHLFELSPEEVRFEDVVQSGGREPPGWKAFLLSWTAYLGKTEGRLAQRLYEEAVLLLNDWDASVRAAAQYVGIHPGLYEKLLLRARDAGDRSAAPLVLPRHPRGRSRDEGDERTVFQRRLYLLSRSH